MSGVEALGVITGELAGALWSPTYHGVGTALLAVIFALSGMVKMIRPRAAAWALVDFDVIRRPRIAIGYALGGAELGLAAWLFSSGERELALLAAATVLLFFTYFLARQLARGKRSACFCFGDSDAPLSRYTLARTAGLAMLASVLLLTVPFVAESDYRIGVPQAVTATGAVGTVLLLGQLARLVRRSAEPLALGDVAV